MPLIGGVGVDLEGSGAVGRGVEAAAVRNAGRADDRAGGHHQVRLEPGLRGGEGQGDGVFVDDGDVADLLLAALGELAVRRQVGVAAEVEVLLDEIRGDGRAIGEGRGGVEVEGELRLVFVVLEVR